MTCVGKPVATVIPTTNKAHDAKRRRGETVGGPIGGQTYRILSKEGKVARGEKMDPWEKMSETGKAVLDSGGS